MCTTFDFGLRCTIRNVTTGPRDTIGLFKSIANISNVKVKRISFKNIIIIVKSQCSLVAAITSWSNRAKTCLRENGLRNLCLPHSLSSCSPCGSVPVAPHKGHWLWLLGGHTSFSGRGGGHIRILSKVLNEKRNHVYSNT